MAEAWIQPDRPHLTRSGLFLVGAVLAFPIVAAFVMLAAPKLAALQHRALPVLAANHLVTLGWGTMVALGALHQLLPAAAGVRHEPGRIVAAQFAVHVAGVALLVIGFWWRATLVLIAGGIAVVASILASVATAGWVLRRRTRWSPPLTFVSVALASLTAVTAWGLLLSVNWRYAFWPGLLTALGLRVHLTLGLLGWFAGLIVGVSYYLLPRFTTRRDLEGLHVRAVFLLLLGALAVMLIGAFTGGVLLRLGLLVAGAAGLLYAADLRRFVAAWGRALDVTRVHWQIIMAETVLLSLGVIALALGWLGPAPVRWVVAGVTLFLTGWVTLAITGQAYKVTPFLMWYYRFALGMPAYDVPRLEAPYWPRGAVPPLVLLGSAGPLISLGILLRQPGVSLAGGIAFFAGACLFAYLLGYSWLPRLWRVRGRPIPPPPG